ncbi:hypothetical protein H920_13861 [Fukomys damarensis]|uniref:Uncharacterized protein n=1 Tax=Fukomys damarensis TaxID=885580 RepID=A0A091DPP0_FUKDA|nr:hypothetical protein H920_13861 [Fukomys damarensis]
MDRFLGFVKQIRRSRRRKGKKYRPEEDYHEGYEDVYYYASEHFRKFRHQNVQDDPNAERQTREQGASKRNRKL